MANTTVTIAEVAHKPGAASFQPSTTAARFLLAALALFTLFLVLFRYTAFPLFDWDETRTGMNALYMAHHGHPLVTYFHGQPDHWMTKPPFLIWEIALLIRAGLPVLLALRLPSMLAAVAAVSCLFVFCWKKVASVESGIYSCLLLICCTMFIGAHGARTGDYDATLTLWVLLYALCFWCFLQAPAGSTRRSRWLALAGLALFLALITKGVAGALPLPAILVYTSINKQHRTALRDPRLWLIPLAALLAGAALYLLRDHADPGYLRAVWVNEFTGRFAEVNEGHTGGLLGYVKVLARKFEPGFLLFLLLPLAAQRYAPTSPLLPVCRFAATVAVVTLAILSLSHTQLAWYAMPLVPLMALSAGAALTALLESARVRSPARGRALTLVSGLLFAASVCFVCTWVFVLTVRGQQKKPSSWYQTLMPVVESGQLSRDWVFADPGYHSYIDHYAPTPEFWATEAEFKNIHVRVQPLGAVPLAPGTWVGTCDPDTLAKLTQTDFHITYHPSRWCYLGQMR